MTPEGHPEDNLTVSWWFRRFPGARTTTPENAGTCLANDPPSESRWSFSQGTEGVGVHNPRSTYSIKQDAVVAAGALATAVGRGAERPRELTWFRRILHIGGQDRSLSNDDVIIRIGVNIVRRDVPLPAAT